MKLEKSFHDEIRLVIFETKVPCHQSASLDRKSVLAVKKSKIDDIREKQASYAPLQW